MIVAARQYTVVTYQVLDPFAGLPVGWILLGAQTPQIVLLALIGTGHYFGLVHGRSKDDRSYAPLGWLAIWRV